MSDIFSSGLRRRRLAFALPLAMLSVGATLAQTAQPRRLALGDAVERARQHHPLIIEARQRVVIAEAERLESGLRSNPSLTVSGENFPVGPAQKGFDFGSGVDWFAIYTQTFETSGKRRLRVSLAEHNLEAAQSEDWAVERRIVYEVKAAYHRVANARLRLELLRENLNSLNQLVGLNEIRVSVEIATMVEKAVREFLEVETVVTKIGRPDLATEAMGVYQGDVYVILKPKEQWTTVRTKEELIEKLDEKLKDAPGVVYNFTQPLAMRLDEVISGVKADVAVKLFGDDPATLEREARKIENVLRHVRGSADVQTEALGGAGELQIAVNRAEMARYGLRVEDLKELIETAVGGGAATEVIDGRKRFDVVVRLPEAQRKEIETIRALLVPAPGGERVTLSQVADIRTSEGPEVINREDAQRRIVIQSNVRGRDIGGFVAEAQSLIEREVKLPAGYYVTWGGEFENTERAMKRLCIVVPLALLLIFLLLYSTFNSLRYTALIIANLPVALVGGVAALWLRGMNLSLSAAVGFIALFGVAALNGLVMVSHINGLRENGSKLREAVLEGAGARLRPVLMTALVASLGFVPMALSTAPGAEVQRPLATVVIGGLISSTLLTLFVLPTLYELIAGKPARESEPITRSTIPD
jgi:CzcA family heavy metal efflux pump